MWLAWTWLGCASLAGLEELDQLPAAFPLTLAGEIGHVTTPKGGGAISVDVAFASPEAASVAAADLRRQAEAKGWRVTDETHEKKRDTLHLEGPGGRLDLGCCPQRADRWSLVLISWWPPAP